MEVMGLMLGEFIDDYTVRVIDVFAMPQSGTGVSVEAVDPVFQTKMLDMLRQTGRYEGAAASLAGPEEDDARSNPGRRRRMHGWPAPRWSSGGTTPTPALAAGCRLCVCVCARALSLRTEL